MSFNINDGEISDLDNLIAQGHECEYGLQDFCFACDPSVKTCLICHRAAMNRARKAYLDFYKNVFMPWNNER